MASDKFKTQMSAPIASRAIVLNSSRPPITSSQKVRQALEYAVDKEGIAQGIFEGK